MPRQTPDPVVYTPQQAQTLELVCEDKLRFSVDARLLGARTVFVIEQLYTKWYQEMCTSFGYQLLCEAGAHNRPSEEKAMASEFLASSTMVATTADTPKESAIAVGQKLHLDAMGIWRLHTVGAVASVRVLRHHKV